VNGGRNGDERNLTNSTRKMGVPTTSAKLCVSGLCGGADRIGFDGADYDREVKPLGYVVCEIGTRMLPQLGVQPPYGVLVDFPGHPGVKLRINSPSVNEEPPRCRRKICLPLSGPPSHQPAVPVRANAPCRFPLWNSHSPWGAIRCPAKKLFAEIVPNQDGGVRFSSFCPRGEPTPGFSANRKLNILG